MLEHLARDWTVDLGCLMDDPADAQHLSVLHELLRGSPRRAGDAQRTHRTHPVRHATRDSRSASPGFREPGLARWVRAGLGARRYRGGDGLFLGHGGLYPAAGRAGRCASSTWWMWIPRSGAPTPRRPTGRSDWSGRGKPRTLLAFERRVAAQFDRTLLVSAQEAQTFATLAPEVASRIDWVENGVDVARFDPARRLA